MDPRAGRTSFADEAERWKASRRANRRTTNARDESVLASLVLPHLGNLALSDITVEIIEQWVSTLVELRKAPATTRKAYQIASQVLRFAVRGRRIQRNPAEGVSLPPLERVERRFLTADEIHDLADAIEPRYRLLVLLGGYAGLRLGELVALRVSSFTTGLRAVRVTESLTDVKASFRLVNRKPEPPGVRYRFLPSWWPRSNSTSPDFLPPPMV